MAEDDNGDLDDGEHGAVSESPAKDPTAVGIDPTAEKIKTDLNFMEFIHLTSRVIDDGDSDSMAALLDLKKHWTEKFSGDAPLAGTGVDHGGLRSIHSRKLTPFLASPITRPARWFPRLPSSEQAAIILHGAAPSPRASPIAAPVTFGARVLELPSTAARVSPPPIPAALTPSAIFSPPITMAIPTTPVASSPSSPSLSVTTAPTVDGLYSSKSAPNPEPLPSTLHLPVSTVSPVAAPPSRVTVNPTSGAVSPPRPTTRSTAAVEIGSGCSLPQPNLDRVPTPEIYIVREVTATSNGFFFFQFTTTAAMEEVIEGGPWLFQGQPIVLQKWEPGMAVRKLKHTQVPMWIKLRYLLVEQWTTDGLSTVASGIGKPLYPDAITRACTRLDFARVCVMLDISSKLPRHVIIMIPMENGGESACKVDVKYEWLPPKCNSCHSLGHAMLACVLHKPPKPAVSVYVQKPIHVATPASVLIVEPEPEPLEDEAIVEPDVMIKDKAPSVLTHVECSFMECSGLNRRDHQIAVQDLATNSRLYFIGLLETRVTLPNATRVQNGILPRWKCLHIYVLVTVTYGANDVGSRRELWQALCTIVGSISDEPWLVGGDFNAVRDLSEVCGTSGDIRFAMNEFNDCILNTGLIALPMRGESFTWHNCSDDGRSLWKRLDQLLANDKWIERWPDVFYDCLTPRTFDHSPLVLRGDCRRPPVSMFRFDNYLALSPSFIASVQDIWRHHIVGTPIYSVTRKLKALKPVFQQQRKMKGDLSANVKLAGEFLEISQRLLQDDRHDPLLLHLEHCCRLVFLKAVKIEKVAIRRANKRIFQIYDEAGNTFMEPNDISNVFVAYYQRLLGGDRTNRAMDLRYLRPWAKHIITDEEASLLVRPITKDDVKTTVFDIEEDRAPGPDGYLSGFFKAAWLVVGEEITAAVMDFFTTGRLLKQVNATLITLIPKIISPSQTAFVPGRSISDNVLLAQELFLGYDQYRLPPCCALKVDLRKAYDTVEWDFLLATLQLFGFPPTFNRWIEECVTSPHFSLYLNGEVHGFFAGAWGLREGNPLSPYLFVLVMEVLHLILLQLIEQDGGFAYHWQCKALGLFQLSFAENLILLCKAEEGRLPLRYLGLPLIVSHLTKLDCQPLLQKIDARISGWDGVGLSFVGRVQLIKSVLLAFEVYWAMVFLLPKGVIKEIVKRIRTFLWKGNSSSGYSKVAWESVCKPIEEGGQGIRDILALNQALMSRYLWSVIKQEKESIWVDWIAHYRLRDASIWTVNAKRGAWGWRKMLELRGYQGIALCYGLLFWGGYPLWIKYGCNTLMDIASYVLMGAWRRTIIYSLLAVSPDTALLLLEDTSDFNGLTWSGNVASCGPRPDGEATVW
ncbi:UNVERIFIED_CONTAM: Transposon TX1 uncharacterized protein [Sesamum calycinum]|uniref:Transposon TX1 uncharacterized protein n=1 Tax=Sesamum calycinum TaxID=2727403 RepID=A0AAW2KMQ9_9LAMI